MIEMDEQFQREFGAAMAQLRALHMGYTGSAENARGEARSIAVSEEAELAITSYEVSHAYWSAAERLRPILTSFEDADRRVAALMVMPEPVFTEPISAEDALTNVANAALHNRVRYLEDQLARLDTALRGRPATLDERIRETETTEDLITSAILRMNNEGEKARADREKERADRLGEVTSAAAKLLGVTTLPEILPALERLVTGEPFDFATLAEGSLIAGQWAGSDIATRRVYVGRFEKQLSDGSVQIARVCNHCDGLQTDPHVINTDLAEGTVRLPTADEILEFGRLSRLTGLLRLPTDGDE
jgi:hypothetical protein